MCPGMERVTSPGCVPASQQRGGKERNPCGLKPCVAMSPTVSLFSSPEFKWTERREMHESARASMQQTNMEV